MTFYIVAIAVLILLSAYFSATETAFSSMNRTRMKTMMDDGNKRAALVCSLDDQYDKLISTILIGNNIVNIASASLATLLFVALYGDMGATISTVVLTILVLIFGEITPKSIAKDCPEKFAMFSAPFMKLLMVVFVPLTFIFSAWKKAVAKLLRLERNEKMSQAELLTLVDEVQQNGSIDRDEGTLLHNAIEFTECTAADILTHRVDLEAVEITDSKEEIALKFTQTKYSRLLVYRDNIDNIIGVVHQKDFYAGTGISKKPLTELLTPVMFVIQQASISSILQQMQRQKLHVAVVVDEYGGTFGMLTMEDILEELVGEIWDEHDEVTEMFQETGENSYRVSSAVAIEDFFAFFNISDETDGVTLNSWVVKKLGKLPREKDSFTSNGLTVTVVATQRHCATAVDVTVLPVPQKEEE